MNSGSKKAAFRAVAAVAVLGGLAGPARAEPPKAKVTAQASVEAVVPGKPFQVGVQFDLEAGWHIYWQNPGDAGLPPTAEWTMPEGFAAGEFKFPVPTLHVAPGDIKTNVHEGKPVLLVTITPPEQTDADRVRLAADIKYLVCNELCLFEDASIALELPVAAAGSEPKPANEEFFAQARRMLPKDKSRFVTVTPSFEGELQAGQDIALVLDLKVATGMHIQSHRPTIETLIATKVLPERTPGIVFSEPVFPEPKLRVDPVLGKLSEFAGDVTIRIPGKVEEAPQGPVHFGGLLTFQACNDKGTCFPPETVSFRLEVRGAGTADLAADAGNGRRAGEQAGETPDGAQEAPAADGSSTAGEQDGGEPAAPDGALQAESSAAVEADDGGFNLRQFSLPLQLIFCFLYGLFINATPCVLPLLSIKVLGFVQQAHESRGRTLMLGMAFGAGVMLFFVVLGLFAASGQNILQYPIAIIALGAVVLALSLSMLGVYNLQVPTAAVHLEERINREGPMASFGKGALAPVLGFACTGPFMAAALGWATQQKGTTAILAFLFMGLGMASPYMLLGANPRWLSFLPKPGNWMITFERIMGFLLLGMVVWLVHPLTAQIGAEGLEWTLIFFVTIGLACWLYGKVSPLMPAAQQWRYRGGALGVILVAAVLIYGWIYPVSAAEERMHRQRLARLAGNAGEDWSEEVPWRLWTPEAVQEHVRAGRTVFVDFTAAWCTVCKANKAIAVNTPEVREKMQEMGVVPLQGDFTVGDPKIAEELQRHDRGGVPLNLIYPAGKPDEPIVLRPNLTKQYLLEKLQEAEASKTQ